MISKLKKDFYQLLESLLVDDKQVGTLLKDIYQLRMVGV